MYFIPNVLSFCIASVFIFITIYCLGLVTLSTQLWREVSLRLLYKYNAHCALSLNRLRKLCWPPSSGRFGYPLTVLYNIWLWGAPPNSSLQYLIVRNSSWQLYTIFDFQELLLTVIYNIWLSGAPPDSYIQYLIIRNSPWQLNTIFDFQELPLRVIYNI